MRWLRQFGLLALLSAAFMAVLHASLAGPEAVAETFA